MFGNPDWNYIITAVSIVLSVWSLFLSFRIKEEVDLTLISWKPSLIKKPGEPEFQCLTIVFQNLGKKVIYGRDILDRIRIKTIDTINTIDSLKAIDSGVPISRASAESNCKFNKVDLLVDNETVNVTFDFLEQKKYLKIHVLTLKEIKGVNVSGKIVGGNDFDHNIETDARWHQYFVGKREADATVFVFPFVSISVFLILFNVTKRMFNVDDAKVFSELMKWEGSSFTIILCASLILIISISIGIAIKNAHTPFAIFARGEKNWYKK